jgi:hypothetical protein
MQPPLGFVLLTHNKPHQVIRLIETLNRMFDHPPIVCHHDFSKSQLPDNLPDNVTLVRPHLITGWGNFSVVEAVLRSLELMYQAPTAPDWFVLLSGSDYPIKPADQILNDLVSSPYDVHISYSKIDHTQPPKGKIGPDFPCLGCSPGPLWQQLCYERYCVLRFWIPFLSIRQLLKRQSPFSERELFYRRELFVIRNPWLTKLFIPFTDQFHCHAGEHWLSANRKAAEYLMDFHATKPALATHFRWQANTTVIVPEEAYYHTIFCNAPHLKVSENNWRYVDWPASGAHPNTLKLEDLEKLQASSAHFGRKFDMDIDTKILDEIDAMVR